jgi:hypothetical protein
LSRSSALADAFTDRRYRLLILLAVFCPVGRWSQVRLSRLRAGAT